MSSEFDKRIAAPTMSAPALWEMSTEDFNNWRELHDYPRIVTYFKTKLPQFAEWMQEQFITESTIIKHCPSNFLKDDSPLIYLYRILVNEKDNHQVLSKMRMDVNASFPGQGTIDARHEIIPYPIWYSNKNKTNSPDISVNSKTNRSHFIFGELELLDLGNCHLRHFFLANRHLDFTNISDLRISHCYNNSHINLFFCSALNLTVEGDLPFVDAYQTEFYEVLNPKLTNLKLLNGSLQTWNFRKCSVNLTASNAVIHLWNFVGWDFTATIDNSDVRECTFANMAPRYPIDLGRIRDFHAEVKRMYSQLGKKKKAGNHYFLEKTYERKAFLHVKENYMQEYFRAKSKSSKGAIAAKYLSFYFYSGFLNILWGYGERPSRVLRISIGIILLFALIYCLSPQASTQTKHNFTNSLYYSLVTFTTLGYGDISQTSGILRLVSGIEALAGMTFWGVLIAGFTSNSKDY